MTKIKTGRKISGSQFHQIGEIPTTKERKLPGDLVIWLEC